MKSWNELSLKFNKGEGVPRNEIFNLCVEFKASYFKKKHDEQLNEENCLLSENLEIWLAHLLVLKNQAKISHEEILRLQQMDDCK
jgi:hypothetical protein